jgi:hypothetical protein
MPRGHPGTAAKPPVSVSDKEPGEKRKLKPRGKPFEPGNRNGAAWPQCPDVLWALSVLPLNNAERAARKGSLAI